MNLQSKHQSPSNILNAILTSANPIEALERLRTSGEMHDLIPELCDTFEMTQNHYHFGTVWQHTLKVVQQVPADFTLRMAALLHDIGKITTRTQDENGKVQFIGHEIESARLAESILLRLGYDENFVSEICFLVRNHMVLKGYGSEAERLKTKKLRQLQHKCRTQQRFENLLALIHADNCSHADGYCLPLQVPAVQRQSQRLVDKASAMFGYTLPLSNKDIMRLKGVEFGPQLKECRDFLWKLAYVNPLRPREEFEKHLIGYHLKDRE